MKTVSTPDDQQSTERSATCTAACQRIVSSWHAVFPLAPACEAKSLPAASPTCLTYSRTLSWQKNHMWLVSEKAESMFDALFNTLCVDSTVLMQHIAANHFDTSAQVRHIVALCLHARLKIGDKYISEPNLILFPLWKPVISAK